jgi:hypothetical protein
MFLKSILLALFSPAVWFVTASLAGKALMDWADRGRPEGPFRVRFATSGAVVVLAGVQGEVLRRTLVIRASDWGELSLRMFLVFVATVVLTIPALAVVQRLSLSLLGKVRQSVLVTVERCVSVPVLGLLILLSLASAIAARGRPGIDDYLGKVLAPGVATPVGARFSGYCSGASRLGAPHSERREDASDVSVLSDCEDYGYCEMVLVDRNVRATVAAANGSRWTVSSCANLDVARIAPDMMLVRAQSHPSEVLSFSIESKLTVFRREEGRWMITALPPGWLLAHAGPPRGSIVCAFGGLLLIALLGFGRRRARRRVTALDRVREGVPEAGGWIVFEDGTTVPLASPTTLAPGPVLVLAHTLVGTGYRDGKTLAATDILPGILAEHVAADANEVLRYEAWALAIAGVTAAPLVAAASVGLLRW